jgi:plasmid replication initiation protein
MKSSLPVHHVNMKNELIRAAHGLTLMEKRLLMLAVAKLDSGKPATPQNMTVKIHVSEFVAQYGVTAKSTYGDVRQATEHLMDRYIRFFSQDGKKETRMQWVGQATYEEDAGTVELGFWHALSPLLFELEKHFTSYKLSRVGGLRSVYSWRLFELLMQFKKTGYLRIETDSFRDAMETPKTYQKDFSLLRIKCIEPAVKEIREKDGLNVTWKPIKTGRKVTALEFRFPQEQQTALSLNQPKPSSLTPQQISRNEAAQDLAHLEKLAALSGQPVESLLPERLRKKAHT